VKQCLKFDIGIFGVTDTEREFSRDTKPFGSYENCVKNLE
jgi:hypothetical protein